MNPTAARRRTVVIVFFLFMLLHQADKLLIGPLTTPIMETFGIDEARMGAISTGALLVAAVLYPVWGYLYDRFARPKLIALAALIWGATTWLSAIAPTYRLFLITRASTGVDDSSYPGIHSLIADYFPPQTRGKIYGTLQLTAPLGYLIGMVAALMLRDQIGWRGVFYLTGSLGLLLAALIFFLVKEAPRGSSEPELAQLAEVGVYRFEWAKARALLRKPTLLFLFAQGFFGVFPWNVITFWFFRYLETERNYSSGQVLTTMGGAVIVLSGGYFIGGALGDWMFRRTPRGRAIVAMTGILMGAVLLWFTINTPVERTGQFMLLLMATAVFIPFAGPNVLGTVGDVTLPEVRSTALSMQMLLDAGGAALAPLLAGLIAARSSLGFAILSISLSTWLICGVLFGLVVYRVPTEIAALRREMEARARQSARPTAP